MKCLRGDYHQYELFEPLHHPVIPGRERKRANPESRHTFGDWNWTPDRRFAASGMTAEFAARAA
jgi:hypothetical protein